MSDPLGADRSPSDAALGTQLTALGRSLDLGADVSAAVVDVIHARARRARRALGIAAAVIVLAIAVAVVVPSARHTLARWFGLDAVQVEVDPDLSLPDVEASVPSSSRVYDVDGRTVTVTRLGGHFDELTISKTVASTDQIREVTVGDRPGLWFPVAHAVLYLDPDGRVVSEGIAGSTLLVETDDGIIRVEGFDDVADAVAFVAGT